MPQKNISKKIEFFKSNYFVNKYVNICLVFSKVIK